MKSFSPARRSCWATISRTRSPPRRFATVGCTPAIWAIWPEGELFVCGRAKDIIIVNGRKFHPQDLEWAVDTLAGVRRGRVVAFGATADGHADRVVIVAEPSGTVPAELLTEAIRREIGELFGLYVDDVAIVRSGTVGRTTSGKVQRAATKARYERGELAADRRRAETTAEAES